MAANSSLYALIAVRIVEGLFEVRSGLIAEYFNDT